MKQRLWDTTVDAAGQGAKIVQGRQYTLGGDFEDRAGAVGPTLRSRPVEIPIAGQHQPHARGFAIGAVRLDAKAVQGGQCPLVGDLEDCPFVLDPAAEGCPVEIPVRALNQSHSKRIRTIGVVEIYQSVEGLCRRGNRRRGTKQKNRADILPAAKFVHTESFGLHNLCPVESSACALGTSFSKVSRGPVVLEVQSSGKIRIKAEPGKLSQHLQEGIYA